MIFQISSTSLFWPWPPPIALKVPCSPVILVEKNINSSFRCHPIGASVWLASVGFIHIQSKSRSSCCCRSFISLLLEDYPNSWDIQVLLLYQLTVLVAGGTGHSISQFLSFFSSISTFLSTFCPVFLISEIDTKIWQFFDKLLFVRYYTKSTQHI